MFQPPHRWGVAVVCSPPTARATARRRHGAPDSARDAHTGILMPSPSTARSRSPMPESEQTAQRLATIQAAREVVPSDPDHPPAGIATACRARSRGGTTTGVRGPPHHRWHRLVRGRGPYRRSAAGQVVLVETKSPTTGSVTSPPGNAYPSETSSSSSIRGGSTAAPSCRRSSPRSRRWTRRHRDRVSRLHPGGGDRSSARHRRRLGPARLAHIFGLLAAMADSPTDQRQYLAAEWSIRTATTPTAPPTASTVPSASSSPTSRTPVAAGGDRPPRGDVESAFSRYFARVTGVPSPTPSAGSASLRPASCCVAPRCRWLRSSSCRLRQPVQLQPAVPRPPWPHPRQHRG